MQIPAISHGCFPILAALMDGEPRTRDKVARRAGFDAETVEGRQYNQFSEYLNTLHHNGLITKFIAPPESLAGERRPSFSKRAQTVVIITPDGETAFRETADFYLFYIRQFAERPGDDGEGDNVQAMLAAAKEQKRQKRRRDVQKSWRFPTPDEERQILAKTTKRFALFYRAWREFDRVSVPLYDLCAANVGDVNLQAGTMQIGNRVVALNGRLTELLQLAADGRSDGPLFLNRKNNRWHRQVAREAFQLARDKCGLPENIKLCGPKRQTPRPRLNGGITHGRDAIPREQGMDRCTKR